MVINTRAYVTPKLKDEIERLMREEHLTRQQACNFIANKAKRKDTLNEDLQRLFY